MTIDQYISKVHDLYKSGIATERSFRDEIAQLMEKSSQVQTPNRTPDIIGELSEKTGLTFIDERENGNVCFANNNEELRDEFKQTFAPIDMLDYIYAVLHSPNYREKYEDFLKIDTPKVPIPKDADSFWQLVTLGEKLRQIHLLGSPIAGKSITPFPIEGSNVIDQIRYQESKVYINSTQYFDTVPEAAWNLYMGGYQPAQKWLKDRKSKKLNLDDISDYQKIIFNLTETSRLIQEIAHLNFEE